MNRHNLKLLALALPRLKQFIFITIMSIITGLLLAEYISYTKVRSIINAINYSVNNQISNHEFSSFLSMRGLVSLERDNIKSTSIYKLDKHGKITYRSGFKLNKKLTADLTLQHDTYMQTMIIPGQFIHYNAFKENNLVSIIVMKDPFFLSIAAIIFAFTFIIGNLSLVIFNDNTARIAIRVFRQFIHEVKNDRTVRKMLSSLPALIDPRLTSLSKPVSESLDNILSDLIDKYGTYAEFDPNFDHDDIHVLDIKLYPALGNAIKNAVNHGTEKPIRIETKIDTKYLYFTIENGLYEPLRKSDLRSMIKGSFKEKDGMAIIHDNLRRINGVFNLDASDTAIKIQFKIPRKNVESSKPSSWSAKKMGIKTVAVLDDVDEERMRVWSQVYLSLKISAARYSHLDKMVEDLRNGKRFDLLICDQQGHYSERFRSWDVVRENLDYTVKDELKMHGTILILHSKGAFRPTRKNLFDHYVQKDPKNDWSQILPHVRENN